MTETIKEAMAAAKNGDAPVAAIIVQHDAYLKWMPEIIGGFMKDECDTLKLLPTFNRKNKTTQ